MAQLLVYLNEYQIWLLANAFLIFDGPTHLNGKRNSTHSRRNSKPLLDLPRSSRYLQRRRI